MQQRLRALPPEIHYRTGHLGVIASTAAFTEGDAWLDALLAHLDRNRRLLATLLAEELPAIRYVPPEAGFLAWLDCTPLGLSAEPAATFLERGRVAFVPGAQFGAAYGSFVRLNFATTQTLVHAIVARMRASA
jgi:cystathionine beta-lyase